MFNKKEKRNYFYLNISGESVEIDDFCNFNKKANLTLSDDHDKNLCFLRHCMDFIKTQFEKETYKGNKK